MNRKIRAFTFNAVKRDTMIMTKGMYTVKEVPNTGTIVMLDIKPLNDVNFVL